MAHQACGDVHDLHVVRKLFDCYVVDFVLHWFAVKVVIVIVKVIVFIEIIIVVVFIVVVVFTSIAFLFKFDLIKHVARTVVAHTVVVTVALTV